MISERLINDTLLISPRALTNNATVTANMDTKGGNYATIRVCMGSEVNTSAVGPTLVLSESDDTVVSNFATLDTEATVGGQSMWERDQIGVRGTERFDVVVHDYGSNSEAGPIVGLETAGS